MNFSQQAKDERTPESEKRERLVSTLGGECGPIEVIVDEGSTGGAPQICGRLAGAPGWFVVIRLA